MGISLMKLVEIVLFIGEILFNINVEEVNILGRKFKSKFFIKEFAILVVNFVVCVDDKGFKNIRDLIK